jgi:hypothetical protein
LKSGKLRAQASAEVFAGVQAQGSASYKGERRSVLVLLFESFVCRTIGWRRRVRLGERGGRSARHSQGGNGFAQRHAESRRRRRGVCRSARRGLRRRLGRRRRSARHRRRRRRNRHFRKRFCLKANDSVFVFLCLFDDAFFV